MRKTQPTLTPPMRRATKKEVMQGNDGGSGAQLIDPPATPYKPPTVEWPAGDIVSVNIDGQKLFSFGPNGTFYWLDVRDGIIKTVPDVTGMQAMFAAKLKGVSDEHSKQVQITQQLAAKYEYVTKVVINKLENGTLTVE